MQFKLKNTRDNKYYILNLIKVFLKDIRYRSFQLKDLWIVFEEQHEIMKLFVEFSTVIDLVFQPKTGSASDNFELVLCIEFT